MYKVEKNIPIQKPRRGKDMDERISVDFIKSLKVGDSFFIPKSEYKMLSSLRTLISYRVKRIRIDFDMIYIIYVGEVEGGYRVWRTS